MCVLGNNLACSSICVINLLSSKSIQQLGFLSVFKLINEQQIPSMAILLCKPGVNKSLKLLLTNFMIRSFAWMYMMLGKRAFERNLMKPTMF